MDNGILTFGCNAMNDFYVLVVHSKKNNNLSNMFRYSKFSCFSVLYDEFLKAIALMPSKTNGSSSNGDLCLEMFHQTYFPNCNSNLNEILDTLRQ